MKLKFGKDQNGWKTRENKKNSKKKKEEEEKKKERESEIGK